MLNLKDFAISIFTYNKVKCFEELIYSIYSNEISNKLKINVFIDGSVNGKNEVQEKKIRFLKSLKKKNLKIFCNKFNYGLNLNISNNINKTFKISKAAIFLEDDVLISKNYLDIAVNLLKLLQNNKQIYLINGLRPNEKKIKLVREYDLFYSYRYTSQAFFTWKKKWEQIEPFIHGSFIEPILDNKDYNMRISKGGNDSVRSIKEQIINKGFVTQAFRVNAAMNFLEKNSLYINKPISTMNFKETTLSSHMKTIEPKYINEVDNKIEYKDIKKKICPNKDITVKLYKKLYT